MKNRGRIVDLRLELERGKWIGFICAGKDLKLSIINEALDALKCAKREIRKYGERKVGL